MKIREKKTIKSKTHKMPDLLWSIRECECSNKLANTRITRLHPRVGSKSRNCVYTRSMESSVIYLNRTYASSDYFQRLSTPRIQMKSIESGWVFGKGNGGELWWYCLPTVSSDVNTVEASYHAMSNKTVIFYGFGALLCRMSPYGVLIWSEVSWSC